MKKSIIILLALLLVTSSIFAVTNEGDTQENTINITAPVAGYTLFGVTSDPVDWNNLQSRALFESSTQSSIETEIDILDLANPTGIGYVSGINNTHSDVTIKTTTTDLVSGDDVIGISVASSYQFQIPGAADSKIGILQSQLIKIKETNKGNAAKAPAGNYSATVTISLTSN